MKRLPMPPRSKPLPRGKNLPRSRVPLRRVELRVGDIARLARRTTDRPEKTAGRSWPRNTSFPRRVRDLIIARDTDSDGNLRCGGCRRVVSPGDYNLQHRQPRGAGGTRNPEKSTASNGVVLCGSPLTGCHGHAESHRDWALEHGFLVLQCEDPREVPIHHAMYGLVYLTDDGGIREVPFTPSPSRDGDAG